MVREKVLLIAIITQFFLCGATTLWSDTKVEEERLLLEARNAAEWAKTSRSQADWRQAAEIYKQLFDQYQSVAEGSITCTGDVREEYAAVQNSAGYYEQALKTYLDLFRWRPDDELHCVLDPVHEILNLHQDRAELQHIASQVRAFDAALLAAQRSDSCFFSDVCDKTAIREAVLLYKQALRDDPASRLLLDFSGMGTCTATYRYYLALSQNAAGQREDAYYNFVYMLQHNEPGDPMKCYVYDIHGILFYSGGVDHLIADWEQKLQSFEPRLQAQATGEYIRHIFMKAVPGESQYPDLQRALSLLRDRSKVLAEHSPWNISRLTEELFHRLGPCDEISCKDPRRVALDKEAFALTNELTKLLSVTDCTELTCSELSAARQTLYSLLESWSGRLPAVQ